MAEQSHQGTRTVKIFCAGLSWITMRSRPIALLGNHSATWQRGAGHSLNQGTTVASHAEPSFCISSSYLLPWGCLIAIAINPLVICNFNQSPKGFPTRIFPLVLLSPHQTILGYLSRQMLKWLFQDSKGAANSLIIDGLLYVRLGICSTVKLNDTMQGLSNSFQSWSEVAVILFIFLKLWPAMCFQLQVNANQSLWFGR